MPRPNTIAAARRRLTEWADESETEARYGDPGSVEVYPVMLDDIRLVLEALDEQPPAGLVVLG